ncbi:MAG: hypothetical protein IJB08_05930 [Alistipes sp.]|nr:hypothetical protein [Alistipes sp.]
MKRLLCLLTLLLPFATYAYNGEMLTLEMGGSKIYPGTDRKVMIYVPRQYDASAPAALIVGTDSQEKALAECIDSLIVEGTMPVTIAVVVRPGRIHNAKGEVVRYNRSNEYDRMDGRFALFLEKEVLPEVERMRCADGRAIKLSKEPSMRAITGSSSGGICAFNAAWQRPDMFSRVYAMCGTFVPFRGGDQFPALVRKGEPRALRIFLQDNDKDTWNPLFGSWFEYNTLMLSALQFAGYDVRHQWDKGGHSGRNGRAIMKEVMRWLWSDWQSGVKVGMSGNKSLNDIIIPGEGWHCIADEVADGAMVYPYDDEQVMLRIGRRNEAVAVSGERTKIKGRIALPNPYKALYPGGAHTAVRREGSNWVWQYINTPDGKLSHGQEFYYLYTDAGQMLFDAKGYLYVATAVGVQICDQNGRVRAILSLPGGSVESIAFAGNNLFAISGGKLYVRKLLRSGVHQGSPKSEGQG